MPNTQDWKPGSKFDCLIIAPFKAGKTFGALTFPRPNVLDFDGGIATANNADFIKLYGRKSIEYETFREKNVDPRGIVKTHNALDDACRYFDKWMLPANRDKFDTWVIDSGTSLNQMSMNKSMVWLGDKQSGLGITSNTHAGALKTGIIVPKLQDYGAQRSVVEQFIKMVKDTDKHCVVLCHQIEVTNEEGALTDVLPLLTGASRQAVPAMFDEVYYLKLNRKGPNWERVLQTQPDGVRKCGSRLGLPDGTPWNWESIQAALATQVAPK